MFIILIFYFISKENLFLKKKSIGIAQGDLPAEPISGRDGLVIGLAKGWARHATLSQIRLQGQKERIIQDGVPRFLLSREGTASLLAYSLRAVPGDEAGAYGVMIDANKDPTGNQDIKHGKTPAPQQRTCRNSMA